MDLLTAIILGIVQGVTEFLPVSSTGHIAVIANLMGDGNNLLQMAAFLHVGTLIGLIAYFRKDIGRMSIEFIRLVHEIRLNAAAWIHEKKTGEDAVYVKLVRTNYRKMTVMLCVAVPVSFLAGALLRRAAYYAGRSNLYVGAAFFVTAIILLVSDMVEPGSVIPKELPLWKSTLIGLAQGLAVIPGISGAALTIACGSFVGLNRKNAVRFSYLLSIPAVIGALVVELHSGFVVGTLDASFFQAAALGTAAAGVTGFLTVGSFMRRIRKTRFRPFSVYCAAVGAITIILSFIS